MALCHNKQYENYYCKYVREKGIFAVRVAGSGASEGAPCDVVTIANGKTYLVEVKAIKAAEYRIPKIVRQQLEDLRKVALSHQVTPMLVVRFKNRGWVERDITYEVPIVVGM